VTAPRRDAIIQVPPADASAGRDGGPVKRGRLWVYENGLELPVIAGGAVTAHWYRGFFKRFLAKDVDLDADTLKCTLHTSTYTPNQDTHEFASSLSNEVTGTGYTAGGVTLTTVAQNVGTTLVWAWDADDVSWATSTITARYAVLSDTTPGTAATNPLISYVDFGADVPSSGGTFQITWDAAGIGKVTVS
jgi:hypothetical protein